jgi:hypothetical protein
MTKADDNEVDVGGQFRICINVVGAYVILSCFVASQTHFPCSCRCTHNIDFLSHTTNQQTTTINATTKSTAASDDCVARRRVGRRRRPYARQRSRSRHLRRRTLPILNQPNTLNYMSCGFVLDLSVSVSLSVSATVCSRALQDSGQEWRGNDAPGFDHSNNIERVRSSSYRRPKFC